MAVSRIQLGILDSGELRMMREEWIVVLEVAANADADVGPSELERLLGCLAEHYPSALHAEDRYALQLVVQGPAPDAALADALHLWRRALRCCGLPGWTVVRAEVKTPAELAAEYEANGAPAFVADTQVDGKAVLAAYRAARRLVAASRPAEVAAAVLEFVHDLGGVVVAAETRHADAIPVDVSLGLTAPLTAVAPDDLVRRRLEELLPVMVEDARTAALRLGSSDVALARSF
jgi:hypothetical protein